MYMGAMLHVTYDNNTEYNFRLQNFSPLRSDASRGTRRGTPQVYVLHFE